MPHAINWNSRVKLILTDVDETIADLYTGATPEMITELSSVLRDSVGLFFITGQSLPSVLWRIVDQVPKNLRSKILVGVCSGAEVWGFDHFGELLSDPYFSLYDEIMTKKQKLTWRKIITQLIEECKLKPYKTSPITEFRNTAGNDPLAIMMEDRGAQITFEVVNGYNLAHEQVKLLQRQGIQIPKVHETYDVRQAIMKRAEELFAIEKLPVTPRLGGIFALDFTLRGVNKTTAIQHGLKNPTILHSLGLTAQDVAHPEHLEIWGDKFSILGGSDRHMSEAVDKRIRSIDFRPEDPNEFPSEYNIVLWDGTHHLHEGTLEYLQSRHQNPIPA